MMKRFKNQSGQFLLETILLMLLMLGLFTFLRFQFQSQELLSDLVQGPWKKVSLMVEKGVWSSRGHHPTRFSRHRTREGEKVGE